MLEDFYSSWALIVLLLVIAAVLSFLYIMIMRWILGKQKTPQQSFKHPFNHYKRKLFLFFNKKSARHLYHPNCSGGHARLRRLLLHQQIHNTKQQFHTNIHLLHRDQQLFIHGGHVARFWHPNRSLAHNSTPTLDRAYKATPFRHSDHMRSEQGRIGRVSHTNMALGAAALTARFFGLLLHKRCIIGHRWLGHL